MDRLIKIAVLSFCFLLPAVSAVAGQKERPNILCLVCEDISSYLGCYGDPMKQTPNLDALAAEGIRYTNMHTTVGVCAPSRFALITGMYPSALGANNMRVVGEGSKPEGLVPYEVVLPADVRPYPEYLRAAGYYCTNNAKNDYQFYAPVSVWDDNSKTAHWKNRPEGMPFFAIFNCELTHESQTWKRAGEPLTVDPQNVPLPPYYPDNDIVRRDVAVMYSNVRAMDRFMQQKIDELEKADLLDNTIIIWYSDNGGPLPRGKREIYETGTNVPFIVRFPDKRDAGTVDSGLHMFIDIPATVLSLAGIEPPAYMHGRAFLGPFAKPAREYVYGASDRFDEFADRSGAIRDARYRYIRNYHPEKSGYKPVEFRLDLPMMRNMLELYDAGKLNRVQSLWFDAPRPAEEFYDVQADPYEVNNLIGDPRYASQIDRLRKEYERWVKKYNKNWFVEEKELRETFWPGGNQPVTAAVKIKDGKDGSVTLSCSDKGASIAYQIDGKSDKERWLLYTGPVFLKPGQILKAVAHRAGYKPSAVERLTY